MQLVSRRCRNAAWTLDGRARNRHVQVETVGEVLLRERFERREIVLEQRLGIEFIRCRSCVEVPRRVAGAHPEGVDAVDQW